MKQPGTSAKNHANIATVAEGRCTFVYLKRPLVFESEALLLWWILRPYQWPRWGRLPKSVPDMLGRKQFFGNCIHIPARRPTHRHTITSRSGRHALATFNSNGTLELTIWAMTMRNACEATLATRIHIQEPMLGLDVGVALARVLLCT